LYEYDSASAVQAQRATNTAVQYAEPVPVGASSAEPVGTALAFLAPAVRLQPHMVYSTANVDIQASSSAADDRARPCDMPHTKDNATECSTPPPTDGDGLASAGDAYEVPMDDAAVDAYEVPVDDAAGAASQAYDANHMLVYTGAVPVPPWETYAVPVPVCDRGGTYTVPATKTGRHSATTASSLLVRRAEAAAATRAGTDVGTVDCAHRSTRDQMQCRQKVRVGGTAYCANHTCPACNINAKQWSTAACTACAACLGKCGGVAVARPYINVESDLATGVTGDVTPAALGVVWGDINVESDLAPDDVHTSSASIMTATTNI